MRHPPAQPHEPPPPPPLPGSGPTRCPAWSETPPPPAPPFFSAARHSRPIPLANTNDTQSADSNSMSLPIGSPRLGSCPAYRLDRSIDASPRPNACPSLETRCHPRSRPPLVLVSAWRVTPGCAFHRAVFRRSMAPSPPNGVGTGASLGCSQDTGAPPSAQCSCSHRVTAIPCSSSSKGCAGLGAPRLSPGPQYMPRSVSLVGLARLGVIPQNNCTPKCFVLCPSSTSRLLKKGEF